ncbi:MAG: phosphatase PAP2 family protein [Bacteroidota bacterium]|jgi:membrane-associated phospholipid phosphatase
MLQKIIEADRHLFDLINQQWIHPITDVLMPFIRNQFTWVPVYFFLLIFGYLNFRKTLIPWIGFFLLTFALTDMVSTQILKELIQRPRPCWDSYTSDHVRMLIPCSHAYSFVSSHAANHFGMSVFLFVTLRPYVQKGLSIVFVWAALVCLAQVYVGAHYPGDVVGGGILGIVIGKITSNLFIRYAIKKPSMRENTHIV